MVAWGHDGACPRGWARGWALGGHEGGQLGHAHSAIHWGLLAAAIQAGQWPPKSWLRSQGKSMGPTVQPSQLAPSRSQHPAASQ